MHDDHSTDTAPDAPSAELAGDAASGDPARGLAAVRALRTLADTIHTRLHAIRDAVERVRHPTPLAA